MAALGVGFTLALTAPAEAQRHGGWGRGGGGGWRGGPSFSLGFGFGAPFGAGGFYDPFFRPYYGPPVVYAPPVYGPPPVAYAPYPPPAYPPDRGPSYSDQRDNDPRNDPRSAPDYANPDDPDSQAASFYSWPLGIQGGSCNVAYIAKEAGAMPSKPTPDGSQGAVEIGGIAVGQLVGGAVGQRMKLPDQACVMQSLELAKTGSTVAWSEGGVRFDVQPTRTFYRDDEQPCREYRASAHISKSKDEQIMATACRADDGVWEPA